MGNRIPASIEEYYHVYNRGVDKREIFLNNHDYQRFSLLMYLCNGNKPVNIANELQKGRTFFELWDIDKGDPLVAIGAYVLMPNHFHILATPRHENGLSVFMKKLSTGYSMYFNKKNDRTGSLFEGRYKSKHVDTDVYLNYLIAYIHLNPVKLIDSGWKENGISDRQAAESFLNSYNYSSYLDYLGESRVVSKICNPEQFPQYFESKDCFREFISSWLEFQEQP
jgi:putative transposase